MKKKAMILVPVSDLKKVLNRGMHTSAKTSYFAELRLRAILKNKI